MAVPRLAVTCVRDARLRGVCAILLRHAGYRIVETESVEEAKAAIEARPISMIVTGAIADPDDELTAFARGRDLASVRLAPEIQIEALLRMFESIQS